VHKQVKRKDRGEISQYTGYERMLKQNKVTSFKMQYKGLDDRRIIAWFDNFCLK
jgi:hypothetical protein